MDEEFELEVEFAINENVHIQNQSVESSTNPSRIAFAPAELILSTSSSILQGDIVNNQDENISQQVKDIDADIPTTLFEPSLVRDDSEFDYLSTKESWASASKPKSLQIQNEDNKNINIGSSYELPTMPDELDIEAAAVEASLQKTQSSMNKLEDDDFGDVLEDAISAAAATATVPSSTIVVTPFLTTISSQEIVNDYEFSSSTPIDNEFSASTPSSGQSGQLIVASLDLDSLNSEAVSSSESIIVSTTPIPQTNSTSSISSSISSIQPSRNALFELQASLLAQEAAVSVVVNASNEKSNENKGHISGKIISVMEAGPLTSLGEEDEENEEEEEEEEESEEQEEQEKVSAKEINAEKSQEIVFHIQAEAIPTSTLSVEEAELEAEFDRATAATVAQLASQEALSTTLDAPPKKRLPLAFDIASKHLLSDAKTKPFLSSIIPTAVDPESTCLSRLISQKLSLSLIAERDAIFCIAKAQYDPHDTIHEQLITTLFSLLTNTEAVLGRTSWQTIGFQRDNDFTTDLRGGGLLGPLQALALIEGRPWLTRAMFQASQDPISGFPFMIQSISLTAKALQTLRIGSLNSLCNAAASSKSLNNNPVLSVLNDFHAALALAFTRKWRESGATISRMGHIMQEIIPPLCKRPEQAIMMLKEADKIKRISPSGSTTSTTATTSFSKY